MSKIENYEFIKNIILIGNSITLATYRVTIADVEH